MTVTLRPFQLHDTAAVLAMNLASEKFLSPLNETRLHQLRKQSALFWVAEKHSQLVGFLMGFCANAGYNSINYQWFDQRLQHFLYIDRVVVAEAARGLGLGTQFYDAVADWAIHHQLVWLAAEIDIEPPNPGSLAFHQQRGFVAVADQILNSTGGTKRVALQVKSLSQE